MSKDSIEIENLSYRYQDGTQALKGIGLSIPLKKRTVFLGANGSGKSTLLRHLNGLLLPQKGSITIAGKTLNKKTADEIRKTVGLLFDNPDNQIFSPTVENDVSFGPSNLRMPKDEIARRTAEAMEKTDITQLKERSPYNLSLGQKKRCAIAGVIAMTPDILLMDEPFSGLDPVSLRQFLRTLDDMFAHGMTQIMSTHDVDIAYEWAENVVVMCAGELLAVGGTELMHDEELMTRAGLTVPLLPRIFGGCERIPRNSEEARTLLESLRKGGNGDAHT